MCVCVWGGGYYILKDLWESLVVCGVGNGNNLLADH